MPYKKSKLVQLSTYLDEDDIVRVSGCIDGAAIPNLVMHQIILPGKHYLFNLPIRDGIVSVVDVQTKTGVYRRPVIKIHPLEEKNIQ